jgi:hypothetical protein
MAAAIGVENERPLRRRQFRIGEVDLDDGTGRRRSMKLAGERESGSYEPVRPHRLAP